MACALDCSRHLGSSIAEAAQGDAPEKQLISIGVNETSRIQKYAAAPGKMARLAGRDDAVDWHTVLYLRRCRLWAECEDMNPAT